MSLQDNFRKAMRSYVYSVSILSNVSEKNEHHAITVSSVTSVSIDPPSILVCINKSAGIHDTIKIGTRFCINLLTKNHEDLSNVCSSYKEEKNRFTSDQWDLSGIPFLKAISFLRCFSRALLASVGCPRSRVPNISTCS